MWLSRGLHWLGLELGLRLGLSLRLPLLLCLPNARSNSCLLVRHNYSLNHQCLQHDEIV